MLKKLFQMVFTVAVVFTPLSAFSHGTGDGHMMNGVMWGHGVFGLVMTALIFVVAGGMAYGSIKYLNRQHEKVNEQ